MEAFSVVEGFVVALVEDAEREALAHLASEVAELLGVDVAARAAELGLLGGTGSEAETEDQPEETAWENLIASIEDISADPKLVGLPADPAVERLLPTVSDDPTVAEEYRELTQHDLRIAKGDRLVHFWVHLQPENGPLLRLDIAQGEGFMATITDLRLVLTQRLGIRESSDLEALRTAQEMGELDPHSSGLLQVADVLAWWQESLIFGLQMLSESR